MMIMAFFQWLKAHDRRESNDFVRKQVLDKLRF